MYYDIFFNNPLAEIEYTPEGTVINFPGPKQAVVYAVSERFFPANVDPPAEGTPVTPELGFLHCLVTEEQLAQIEADNVAFKFFHEADGRFKNQDGSPPHVFNPAGLVSRKNGEDYIHRVGQTTDEPLNPPEE